MHFLPELTSYVHFVGHASSPSLFWIILIRAPCTTWDFIAVTPVVCLRSSTQHNTRRVPLQSRWSWRGQARHKCPFLDQLATSFTERLCLLKIWVNAGPNIAAQFLRPQFQNFVHTYTIIDRLQSTGFVLGSPLTLYWLVHTYYVHKMERTGPLVPSPLILFYSLDSFSRFRFNMPILFSMPYATNFVIFFQSLIYTVICSCYVSIQTISLMTNNGVY